MDHAITRDTARLRECLVGIDLTVLAALLVALVWSTVPVLLAAPVLVFGLLANRYRDKVAPDHRDKLTRGFDPPRVVMAGIILATAYSVGLTAAGAEPVALRGLSVAGLEAGLAFLAGTYYTLSLLLRCGSRPAK